MSFAVPTGVLVLGLGTFAGKYVAGGVTKELVARSLLVVAAVVVLLAPHDSDACGAWRFDTPTAFTAAFLVVAAEVIATATRTHTGVGVTASTLAFAFANAGGATSGGCNAAMAALAGGGIAAALVLVSSRA